MATRGATVEIVPSPPPTMRRSIPRSSSESAARERWRGEGDSQGADEVQAVAAERLGGRVLGTRGRGVTAR